MFPKFCTSDRFIIKDFTLTDSSIEHIHSYAQKYRHFLMKFQYYKDLLKARTMHIVFLQEKKFTSDRKSRKVYLEFFLPNNSRG